MENICINKCNMRLVLRFLKIANLLPHWENYVEKLKKCHSYTWHWSNVKEPTSIFNHCFFTSYLKREGIIVYGQYHLVSSLFEAYLKLIEYGRNEEAYQLVKNNIMKVEK